MRTDVQVSDFSRVERAFGWFHRVLVVKRELGLLGVTSFRLGYLVFSLHAGRHGHSPVMVGWPTGEDITACRGAC